LSVTTTIIGANGGAGISSVINGTVTPYGGGGGGGSGSGSLDGGFGGVGGGGIGGYGGSAVGTPGQQYTGGGGGGDWNNVGAGAGGSGIVIISYPDIYPNLTSTTPSLSPTTANGYKIYTWATVGSGAFTV
jgi:hypothetical protein